MKPATLTTRDLARHLGVAHSTVARALRNDPRISPAVRLRVTKAAQQLGYRRDPKLAELMAHIRQIRSRPFRGTLAWITDLSLEDEFQKKTHLLYWPHAVRRAEELGYRLDRFTAVKAADAPRLARILKARGIQGVVLHLLGVFQFDEWAWDWNKYAWIFSGSLPPVHKLDFVDADGMETVVNLFETLAAKGYRRIGVATTEEIERCTRYTLCAMRHRFALLHPDHPAFEHCLLPDLGRASARKVAAWIRRHRVDCVVSQVRGMEELLVGINYSPPRKIGLAYQAVRPDGTNSGMNQREDALAIAMVENIVMHVEHGRFGVPDCPRMLLIPGVWQQGRTTR